MFVLGGGCGGGENWLENDLPANPFSPEQETSESNYSIWHTTSSTWDIGSPCKRERFPLVTLLLCSSKMNMFHLEIDT